MNNPKRHVPDGGRRRAVDTPGDVIRPSSWSGQTDCDVGPFCCEMVATRFAAPPIDFGQLETLVRRVERHSGGWYVHVSGHRPRPRIETYEPSCAAEHHRAL